MNPRTKIILFIVVILLIVLIFGVGIGVKKGWFAGLADTINRSANPGEATIKVVVYEGHPMNNVKAPAGVEVHWKVNNFDNQNLLCEPNGQTDLSPIATTGEMLGGTTAQKSDGVYSEFTIDLRGISGDYYLRLDKDPKKSCAFNYFGSMTISPGVIAESANNGHSVKISNLHSQNYATLVFTTSASGGGGGGGSGTISGTVRYADNSQIIPGAVLSLYDANGQPLRLRGATADANGNYSFTNLENATYKVQADGAVCYYSQSSLEDVIVSSANPNPTKNFYLTRESVPSGASKIYGKVTDNHGSILAGTRIRLYRLPSLILPDEILTDSQGNYSFCPVSYGQDYKLNAYKDGYSTKETEIDNIPVGENKVDFVLTAVSQNYPFTMQGTIKGKTGCTSEMLLSGATVTVLDENNVGIKKADGSSAYANTDANGNYSISNLRMIDPNGKIPAKIKVDKYGYNLQYFSFTPVANTTVRVDGTLISTSLKVSISGHVTESSMAVSGAKVYLIDGTSQTQIATSDDQGYYEKNDLSSSYIGRQVTIKATIEQNGQQYHGENALILQCQNQNVDLPIVVPELKDVKVQVKKDGKGINDASVWLELYDGKVFIKQGSTKPTAKIDGHNGMAQFSVATGSTFRFRAIKDDQSGKSKIESLPPFNPDRDIAEVNLLGPVEGSDNLHVVYRFYFHQQTDKGDTVVKQIFDEFSKTATDWKKLVRIAFDPWYKFEWIGNEAYGFIKQLANKDKEEPLTDFLKIDKGLFNRSKWRFMIAEWKLPDNIKKMISNGELTIDWDSKLGFGHNVYEKGSLGSVGENNSPQYQVDIVFPDVETKKAWVKNIFCAEGKSTWTNPTGIINDRNLNLTIDTNGDSSKITYTKVKVDCSGIEPVGAIKDQGIDIYKVDVSLRYRFTKEAARTLRQVIIDMMSKEKGMLAPEQIQGMMGDQGFRLSPDRIEAIIRAYQEGQQSQNNEAASAASTYPLEKGTVYIPEINPGKYQISLTGNDNYQIDNRTNVFEVKENSDTVSVNSRICYKNSVIFEWSAGDLNLKLLGASGMPYGLENTIIRSKSVLAKASTSNVVLLGDSYNAPESSSHAVNTNLKYCQADDDPNVVPQDKQITGRSVVLEMPFVDSVYHNYDEGATASIIASQVDRQAGLLIYNDFSNSQKGSWRKIVTAVENISGTNTVYERIISASILDNYISRPDLYAKPNELFALMVGAYKENGDIVKAQIDALSDNQQKNVIKAMVRFVIETVGANPGDNNLYKTVGHISTAGYNPNLITNGSIFQENFNNLPINRRIQVRYIALLDSIRGSKPIQWISNQINAFNDWVKNLRGVTDTGRLEVRVLDSRGHQVPDALAVVGQQAAICDTDSTGFCAMNAPAGPDPQAIEVRNRATNSAYQLADPNLTVTVRKNATTSVTVLLSDQQ